MTRRGRVALLTLASCADPASSADCHGVCGPGTRCEAGLCVVAPRPTAKAEPEPEGKRRRKGRRRGAAGGDPGQSGVPVEDDSKIPLYNAKRTQVLDMNAGSERLGDHVVNEHMARLEPQFNKCIEAAATRTEGEVPSGRVDFIFSIDKTGKVSSVSAKAPKNLRDLGVLPCLRRAVHGHRFPAFDGPTMGVDYDFKVE